MQLLFLLLRGNTASSRVPEVTVDEHTSGPTNWSQHTRRESFFYQGVSEGVKQARCLLFKTQLTACPASSGFLGTDWARFRPGLVGIGRSLSLSLCRTSISISLKLFFKISKTGIVLSIFNTAPLSLSDFKGLCFNVLLLDKSSKDYGRRFPHAVIHLFRRSFIGTATCCQKQLLDSKQLHCWRFHHVAPYTSKVGKRLLTSNTSAMVFYHFYDDARKNSLSGHKKQILS